MTIKRRFFFNESPPHTHTHPQTSCWKRVTYLQWDLIGRFAIRRVASLVLSDVTAQCNQEVVTVAVGDQSRGGVALKEVQWERGSRLLVEARLRHLLQKQTKTFRGRLVYI